MSRNVHVLAQTVLDEHIGSAAIQFTGGRSRHVEVTNHGELAVQLHQLIE